jgi:hypothetical protein
LLLVGFTWIERKKRCHSASLRKVMRRVLCRTVLFFFGSFIQRGKLERVADLFDETRELFRGLAGDSLSVAL